VNTSPPANQVKKTCQVGDTTERSLVISASIRPSPEHILTKMRTNDTNWGIILQTFGILKVCMDYVQPSY